MSEQTLEVEAIVRQVMAVLGEARAYPRTGREHPDTGLVKDGATIASMIDHTLLQPDATARQIEKLCLEAKIHGFASVCVNSIYVPLAVEILRDTDVKVCTVVGFPLGANLPQVKAYEAEEAIKQGAQEIDMVIHVGGLKSRDFVGVHDDITDVAFICHEHGALCKVILETCLLSDEEKVIGAQLAKAAGADFVKTSTGFSTGGATVADVQLIRAVVGQYVGVKASDGVHSLTEAQAMITAGANRLGTSAGVAIAQAEAQSLAD